MLFFCILSGMFPYVFDNLLVTILFFGAKIDLTSAAHSAPSPAPVQGGGGGSMLGELGATIAQGEFRSTCTFPWRNYFNAIITIA